MKSKNQKQIFRKIRSQKKIFGTPDRPRLSVFRSLKNIYAQIIDDVKRETLAAAGSRKKGETLTGIKAAIKVGEEVAKKALAKGVTSVVFDRGGKPYHGRIKAVAEGARQGGLKF